ncbi:MAG TPA: inverse autotransporter beta domain-containing protein [Azospirillaceae bacterium]|nr:inverse autotransporter beta domain-containing protein [Azospirillaceae bacterium]
MSRTAASAFVIATVALGSGRAMAEAAGDLAFRLGDRSHGILSFQLPVADTETNRTFLDLRASTDSKGAYEANIGLAHRFQLGGVTLGGYGFYDWRETRFGNEFAQVSVGLDAATDRFELRGNFYRPLDERADAGVSFVAGAPRLSGNNVVVPRFQQQEVALTGFDVEGGATLGRFGGLDLKATAGYYRFDETGAPTVDGFKGRIEAVSEDEWSIGTELRDDDLEGTQLLAVFRARLDFSAATKRSAPQRRLAAYIQRDPDIVTAGPSQARARDAGLQALSLAADGTGTASANPTRFLFVKADAAAGGTGTFESPFASVAAAAQAAQAGERIFVHSGTYAGNVQLKAGQQLLGQGEALTASFGGQTATLVAAGARPTLTAPTGNVVTLADDNVVRGLAITASAGTGAANRDQFAALYGSNVRVGTVAGNDFSGNLGTGGTSSVGIRLDNMAGIANTRSETRHFASNSAVLPFHGAYDPDTSAAGLGNAEIVSFSNPAAAGTWGVVTLGAQGAVDVVRVGEGDLAGLPILQRRDNIRAGVTQALGAASFGDITTVSMDPTGRYYAVAVPHSDDMTNGLVELRDRASGAVLQRLTVGIGPDGTAISPDGRWLVVANEAEDPVAPGSVSVIDLTNAPAGRATGTQVALANQTGNFFANPGPNGRTIEIDVDGQPRAAVSHDAAGLQPEYVAFSPDSRYAFVSLQENNGAMVIDLATGQPADVRYFNLGTVSGSTDVNDTNPPVYDFTGRIEGFLREPDGIAAFTAGGQLYFMTADEGDNRNNFGGTRLRGGRSVSVFNGTTGQLVGTTGPSLDAALFAAANAAMAANPAIYGIRDDGRAPHYYPEGRSDRGGVEPEVLTVFAEGTRTYALVGLERGASVMLVDVSNPAAPTPVSFGLLPRDMTRADGFDLAANSEGVATLLLGSQRFGYAGLEDAGQIAIWRINPPRN